MNVSEAEKQRPHKLLWLLWFDKKSISNTQLKKIFCEMDNSSILHHDEIDTTTIREGGWKPLVLWQCLEIRSMRFFPTPLESREKIFKMSM